jgi:hypothetical protein
MKQFLLEYFAPLCNIAPLSALLREGLLLFGGLFRGNILATFFRKRRDFRNLDKHWQQSQTVGNKGKAAISGGFQSVEMRGIEPRSDDRTLSLLRA